MKKLVPLGLAFVVLAAALAIGSPTNASGQGAGLVTAVLNRMERNRQSLKSLRAGISMEKYNAQLRDSEKYHGVVLYVPATSRTASVRIEWNSPQHEILAVINGEYALFQPRLGQVLKGKARPGKGVVGGLLDLMDMSRQELERKFEPVQDVREETLWGGVSTIHLKLVPKGSASFKYAEIWVDSAGMPVQSKVVEKNDDATTIRLENPEKNVRISTEEFKIKLDSSVKIVRG